MDRIYDELSKHGLNKPESINTIREKNGIGVYSVSTGSTHLVLKIFYKNEFRREIDFYNLLKKLKVKTLNIISITSCSILMEDINYNTQYRLAAEEDLSSLEVSKSLAKWYKDLHNKGEEYLNSNPDVVMYCEYDSITENSLHKLFRVLNYNNPMMIQKLLVVLNFTKRYLLEKGTLTYNDFYYVNMIVSKDLSETFMFDYNFLGKGLRSSDYKNITCWFTPQQKKAFLEVYGDIPEIEFSITDILSPIFSLLQATEREVFPNWGNEPLELLSSGRLETLVDSFMEKI